VTSGAVTPVRVAVPATSSTSNAKGSTTDSLSNLRPTKAATNADLDLMDDQPSTDAVRQPDHDATARPSATRKKHKSLKEILEELRGHN
jgi:hypothetical protein